MTRPRPPNPEASQALWDACYAGRAPAEQLPRADRDRLLSLLHGKGWSVAQIAKHTQMTTYTAARILERLRVQQEARR